MQKDGFAVDTEQTGGVVLMRAEGEVDSATVDRLSGALDDAIGGSDSHIVVDAQGITFIDSTGITALVGAHKRMNRTRRRLALVCQPSGALGRALEITGLNHTFECHADRSAAVEALKAAPLIGR